MLVMSRHQRELVQCLISELRISFKVQCHSKVWTLDFAKPEEIHEWIMTMIKRSNIPRGHRKLVASSQNYLIQIKGTLEIYGFQHKIRCLRRL